MMLVDLAKHIANTFEQSKGMDRNAVLERLRKGFDAEWDVPTDKPMGRLLESEDDGPKGAKD
jgi:hypothetical protein